ncbi:MAG: hypothetical protein HY865_07070 [Chloroflexi bacterium]|nr:hypothetical protein [Chloroflexota bacterium]
MPKLFEKDILVHYAQVALTNKATADYPQWETGEEKFVSNDMGIAVATETDREVHVVVSTESPLNMQFLGAANINIGVDGLLVGNELTGDIHQIQWRPGKTKISIFVDEIDNRPKVVEFVLD